VRTDLVSLLAAERGGSPVVPHAATPKAPSAVTPVRIYISHAAEDGPHRETLAAHLATLQREELAELTWSASVSPGRDVREVVDAWLHRADIFVALVSANFLASNFCMGIELETARARHGRGELEILPVRLRPADWGDLWLSSLPVLPEGQREVTSWPPDQQDAAWSDVAGGIRRAVRGLQARRSVRDPRR
jgi:hypothetical protein